MRWLAVVLACTWFTATAANAQVELKNDGFVAGAQVAFQSGFCPSEVGAARFLAPQGGRQLLKVRFLFGNNADTKAVSVVVWDDTAGTNTPGMELYSGDFNATGSASGITEADLTAANVIVPQQFRVGIKLKHMGLPSIARDDDGSIAADKNYILADTDLTCNGVGPFTWFRSQTLGLAGDWVIRAEISAGSGGPGDAGAPDGMPRPTGDPCTGNPQCPIGQYCDTALMACTYDCTSDPDCGEGTCNSLGKCVAATGDGGGCGCRAHGDAAGAGWVVLGIAFLARRRRR